MDPRLLEKLSASKLANEEELEALGEQLKSVLGFGVRIVKRGFIGRGKLQALTALVGALSFKAEMLGGKAHFYTAPSLHGVATSYTECTKEEWVTSLTSELEAAGS